jgi:hypothetical protein
MRGFFISTNSKQAITHSCKQNTNLATILEFIWFTLQKVILLKSY